MYITLIFITYTYKFCDKIMVVFVLYYYATSINSICELNGIDIDVDIDVDVKVGQLFLLLLPPFLLTS